DFCPAAADQLDVIEQEGNDDHRREDAAEPCRELSGDISREGLRDVQRPSPDRPIVNTLGGQRATASGNRALSPRAAGFQTQAPRARGRPGTSAESPPVTARPDC